MLTVQSVKTFKGKTAVTFEGVRGKDLGRGMKTLSPGNDLFLHVGGGYVEMSIV